MKIDDLEWDDINMEHLGRRQLSPIDVGDVCSGKHLAIRGKYGRYNIYGKTKAGRFIRLIIEHLKGNKFRPITAFDMDPSEIQTYKSKIQ